MTSDRLALHRLFGYPDELDQRRMELDCQRMFRLASPREPAGSPSEWRLLLQISADDELELHWGSAFARLYVWIRERDMDSGMFGNTLAILRSIR